MPNLEQHYRYGIWRVAGHEMLEAFGEKELAEKLSSYRQSDNLSVLYLRGADWPGRLALSLELVYQAIKQHEANRMELEAHHMLAIVEGLAKQIQGAEERANVSQFGMTFPLANSPKQESQTGSPNLEAENVREPELDKGHEEGMGRQSISSWSDSDAYRQYQKAHKFKEHVERIYSLYSTEKTSFSEEAFQTLSVAEKKFRKWKNYIQELGSTYENELVFRYIESLETSFPVIKDKRVVLLPLPAPNAVGVAGLKERAERLRTLRTVSVLDDLHAMRGINVRTSTDGDYRLDDDVLPGNAQLRHTFNKILETLLLVYKQLSGRRAQDELRGLLLAALEREATVLVALETFEERLGSKFLEASQEKHVDTNVEAGLEDALEKILQANYKKVRDAEAAAETLQEQYFTFLDRVPFTVYNSLRAARLHRKTSLKGFNGSQQLESWKKIHEYLEAVILDYLHEKLDIVAFEPEPGMPYNSHLHQPYVESEEHVDFNTDEIIRVVNVGFCFAPGADATRYTEPPRDMEIITLPDVVLAQ